ncbi:phosphodiester glycosidase family protein [Solirubrobacter sp. CPCC 204708]|uniref:Phosphodiester glycosidase family protein n=1 Tax=Solirubrobacter deserti TaxID=2282478 RepID=A0ABT4RL27_9ACTN|nr:phosphodiester glycosidase family protein [Solirubrobacter deserti]MBE2319148.1 phosphodiester glycosidase family protein [Solirubrobacter deserti]MDA0139224.1 phosphodiester glycosidase family protein [Solirubrobacter deserti]
MLKRTLTLAAALALLAPPLAVAADQVALIDKTEPVGPGITLRHLKTVDASGWFDHQILTVDLSNPVVKSDSLTAGPKITDTGPLTTAANRVGAVAGVNADFFDIGNSGAPHGGQILGGTLLKTADIARPWHHAGVSKDGIGRLVDMTLEASASLKGTPYTVQTLNASNHLGVPADSMHAYTSAWGTYSRGRGFAGVSNVAEVLVEDNKVVSVATAPGAGEIPEGAFVLIGRDAAADAIKALAPGDAVTLTYGLKDEVARNLQFAVGGSAPLVLNGAVIPGPNPNDIAPRTAIGFKDGGKTMLLVTADGRQSPVLGVDLNRLARTFVELGADTALNLDGGGSTTMVARALGDEGVTVRNSPSDGFERHDPNGVGVFVTPGNGAVDELIVTPEEPRVFPGLRRTLKVKAVDNHDTPVAAGDVSWTGATNGVVTAPADATGTVSATATSGTVSETKDIRVLGTLDTLELSSARMSFAEAGASFARTLRVQGRDREGFTAPIELADLDLGYDDTLLEIEQAGDLLRVTPLKPGATMLVVKVAGKEVKLPITVGVVTQTVHTFDRPNEPSFWTPNGTAPATQQLSMQDGRLKLTYEGRRNMGITIRLDLTPGRIPLPGQPLRMRLRLWSEHDISLSYLGYFDRDGGANGPLGSPIKKGWNDLVWTFPATTKFPVRINSFQVIETNVAAQKNGSVIFDRIEIDSSAEIESPPVAPLREDPLVSVDGSADGDWSFATLSDIQFTAAQPDLAKTGIAALNRIRKSDAELVVLNGDITDLGGVDDLKLARQTLETGGCDLVKAGGSEDTDPNTIPCYYVPGNHESYTASGQGTLDNWIAEFGAPHRFFDHKGTRFILLNSAYGNFRSSGFAQLPMLQQALDTAVADDAVDNVMVFAHHPTNDPGDLDASQLTDRTEVQLIEKLLTDFREESDKGVAMVGSHAQIAHVERQQGVAYIVHPSSGKAPYGTPDRGGFTGWMRWSVDRDAPASEQWLTADVRAFAQSATIVAPDAVEVGDSAQIEGSIVQPSGVLPGSRVVPLRYPMSVRWGGSENLAIGTDEAAAKAAGKAAIFDPATRRFTALKSGEVTLSVEVDSMREYTGTESMAPITTSRVIKTQVTSVDEDAPIGGSVPATLALTMGPAVDFGAFTPGVTKTYERTTTATVISTAGDAALSVSNPGHLTNGAFKLAQPLQVSGLPKTYSGPVTNDVATVGFKQEINERDPLRTGAYATTLTFTLSTTQP